jgi:hypothetical protein
VSQAWLAASVAVLTAAALLVPGAVGRASATSPAGLPLTAAPDAATAVALARDQGVRVEVLNQRTETRSVFAEPGGTMTAELSMAPVRMKRGGSWVSVETDLVRRPRGDVGPRATAVELSFPGGGAQDSVIRYGQAGKWFELTWPGRLPKPTLAGGSATYSDVLPGVDLVLRADPKGFAQYLVVKDAAAARSTSLAKIKWGLRSEGLTLRVTANGALQARDADGAVIFTAPEPQMWDSGAPVRQSAVDTTVDGRSLVLTPDQELLTDPATTFPVIIDPVWTTFGPTVWTKVSSGYPNQSYFNGCCDADGWAKVGQCYDGSGGCNGIGQMRSYFQYDTRFLGGKRILAATFTGKLVYSPSSTARDHDLRLADYGINTGTTWNNAPWGPWLSTVSVPCAGRTGCASTVDVGFPVPPWAVRAGDVSTYFLGASDGSDQLAWRKYDAWASTLTVNYNTQPDMPTDLSTDPPLPAPCRWCAGVRYIGDSGIRLRARLSDPDGDQVRPFWRIYFNGALQPEVAGSYKSSGSLHDFFVDLNNRHDQTVGWELYANDGWDNRGYAFGTGFRVDHEAPGNPPNVRGLLYQEDNRWHGGVGVPDTFTFDSAGIGDIDHFLYGWQDPPATAVDADALGGKASVTLTPPGDGPRDLYVQSVDRAGHRSETQVYHVYVRAGSGPLAQWSFEGNTTDDAFLGDRDGTLHGTAGYGPGAVGLGLRLDGLDPDTNMGAPNTVRTDTSFSVAAWVRPRPGQLNQVMGAVSQDGNQQSSFFLSYRANRWSFRMVDADVANPSATTATAPEVPQLDTWTHLVGVYDRPANKILLYVNGVLRAESALPANFDPWHAGGNLKVGRHKCSGVTCDPWSGSIDEVQIYDRVLSAAEATAIVGRDNVQVAYWKFDEIEPDTTTAANAVEGGAMAVLQNGASFTGDSNGDQKPDGGAVGGAVRFDGVDDVAATSGPVVRTDDSFTVSAWVRPEAFPTGVAATVSQYGQRVSGFYLNYRGDLNRWVFMLASEDRDNPNGLWVVAPSVPLAGDWTHLTGVFDRPANKIRIYVNGALGAEATLPASFVPWHATGPLVVGREKWNGQTGNPWRGLIDEVRVYSRVLSAAEIQGIVSRDDVALGLWKLDGNGNDSSGSNRHGTLMGNPSWAGGQTSVPDPTDLAARLDGVDDHVRLPHTVDVRKSFAVSAWARLNAAGDLRTVLAQAGSRVSAFKLRATADGRWSFVMFDQDVDDGGGRAEVFGGAAQLGVWTHLVAVYDAPAGRISLYVNGVLAGSADHSHTWDYASGELLIGRAKWNGSSVEFFPGSVDDVTVYSRVLFADEIRTIAGRDLSLVHNWALDEGSGTSAADAVGSRTGTLAGGAGRMPGRLGNAVQLDGVDDRVSTTGVDLPTDASFSVSAWVNLATICDPGTAWSCHKVAVSVDGTGTSKFRLGHMADQDQFSSGVWVFEMPESDTPGAQITKAAVSTLPSELDTWVHLVGVYDKASNNLMLYVNANRKNDGTLLTPWPASGPLHIGRGRDSSGAAGQYFGGGVDDVRLYTGVLDNDRISNLYNSYPTDGGTPTLPTADAGYWKFDENTGTVAADSSGRGLTATMRGSAGWLGGGRKGPTAWLNGTSAYAETAGPVLDTAASFSVAAWVYRNQAGTANRTVLAQDGTSVSSFLLQYHSVSDRWRVVVPTADQANPSSVLLTSTEPALLGRWTHLALVYNADLQQLRLYVNGRLSAAQVGVTLFNAGGKLSIGRAKWNGGLVDYFPGGIDDVRAFGRALTDGEVRTVYNDVAAASYGFWRFDDQTVRDYSWRANPTTAAGTVTYPGGIIGQALQLDGATGSATSQWVGADTRDSLTVSAWARLTRNDRVQTVLGQDGSRLSGFVLQYRPNLDRWVFAAPTQDADGAELVYAYSPEPAVLNQWVHLTGVYDHAGRQLRLYVNGELASTRNGVTLWGTEGGFTIGRGKVNGQPGEFFAGMIDEAHAEQGMAADDEIARRASWPAPPATTQLGRYINAAGDRATATTNGAPPAGYHFDRALGRLVDGGQPNTRVLYACKSGADAFTSSSSSCEGQTVLGEIGSVFSQPPANLYTVPIYRCNTGPDHFESNVPGCEGAPQDGLLGYALGYAPLARYYYPRGYDHWGSVQGTPPGYSYEGSHGYVSLAFEPGTQPLLSCRDGVDQFVSIDLSCEGKQVLGNIGYLWTAPPPGVTSRAVYRCSYSVDARTNRFTSTDAVCEGNTVDLRLGYVLAAAPTTAPAFPANLALGKTTTGDSSCSVNETAAKAVNGTWTGGLSDKWCSLGATKWWRVDLGQPTSISKLVIRHAGAGGESTSWNTRDFTIQVSTDAATWTTVVTVTGNTASTTMHSITPVSARYVRLNVQTPTQTTNSAARIYEVEVFA